MTSQTPGYCRLDDYQTLIISGPDRFEFLQGQLTNDTRRLQETGSIRAGWTSPKGRLLACGQLISLNDEIYWPLPADIIENVSRRLQMFVMRAKVNISVSTAPVWGLTGIEPEAPLQVSGQSVNLTGAPIALNDGSMIAQVAGDISRAWWLSASPSSDTSARTKWTLANIRMGLPSIYAGTQDLFVPQMVNLDLVDGISFTKGCYVGQEIVARTQNLGRIKRRMYRFTFDCGAPERGTAVYGPDQVSGKVVISSENEMLAVIPIEHSSADWFADECRAQKLNLVSLPYEINA